MTEQNKNITPIEHNCVFILFILQTLHVSKCRIVSKIDFMPERSGFFSCIIIIVFFRAGEREAEDEGKRERDS